MNDTLVGVDLAKSVFHLAISSRPGRFDSHRRLSRDQFLPFVRCSSSRLAAPPTIKAAVALANKMARIAWAVSVRDTDYRAVPAAA